jgi:hypothetical protein
MQQLSQYDTVATTVGDGIQYVWGSVSGFPSKYILSPCAQTSRACRYNVEQWLGLKSRADHVLHPQHEVLCEVAKWLLPVLCRAPNQTLADFPRHLVLTKVSIYQTKPNNCLFTSFGLSKVSGHQTKPSPTFRAILS